MQSNLVPSLLNLVSFYTAVIVDSNSLHINNMLIFINICPNHLMGLYQVIQFYLPKLVKCFSGGNHVILAALSLWLGLILSHIVLEPGDKVY